MLPTDGFPCRSGVPSFLRVYTDPMFIVKPKHQYFHAIFALMLDMYYPAVYNGHCQIVLWLLRHGLRAVLAVGLGNLPTY